MTEHKLNFKVSPPDARDYKLHLSTEAKVGLPESVDLSAGCTPIRDQGSVGSCTAFASVALYENIYYKFTSNLAASNFSEKFTYYTTRVNVAKWRANDDSGAYVRDALRSLVTYGTCKEETFPYLKSGENSSNFAEVPPSAAYTEALKYQALTYLNIPSGNTSSQRNDALATLKGLLVKGYAFMAGFVCYSNVYNAVKGLIPLPNRSVIGGHAICITGYDDKRQVFKFKNSWGSSWGDKGFGYLPYQYLLTGNMFDIWTIYTVENNNVSIGISKPSQKTVIVSNHVAAGLTNISNNQAPVIPNDLSETDKAQLKAFFDKVISLKSSLISAMNT